VKVGKGVCASPNRMISFGGGRQPSGSYSYTLDVRRKKRPSPKLKKYPGALRPFGNRGLSWSSRCFRPLFNLMILSVGLRIPPLWDGFVFVGCLIVPSCPKMCRRG